jgi:hypothetical protein
LASLHWTKSGEDGCNTGYHITACFFAGLGDKVGPGTVLRPNFKLKAEGYAQQKYWKEDLGLKRCTEELWREYKEWLGDDEPHHAKEQDRAEDDHGQNGTKQNDDDQHYKVKFLLAISGRSQCRYIRNASPRESERLYFGRNPKSQNVEARLARAPSCSPSIIVTNIGC